MARVQLESVGKGELIASVDTIEDTIVFDGTTHTEVASVLTGRRIAEVHRRGKQFWAQLDTSDGKEPIALLMHLGMSGHSYARSGATGNASEPIYFRDKKRTADEWPPKYHRLVITFASGSSWAYTDARRLGRIRLIRASDPTTLPPLSLLGADPYLAMPPLDVLSPALLKRTAPIKAILLDQNGPLCGLGNWLVDEILFNARVHPSQRGNTLSASQLAAIHTQVVDIVTIAVAKRADYREFPATWIFGVRWGKGKAKTAPTITLADGTTGTVSWLTVGGRTSAIVASVQRLTAAPPSTPTKGKGKKRARKAADDDEDDASPVTSPHFDRIAAVLEDEPDEPASKPKRPAKVRRTKTAPAALDHVEAEVKPTSTRASRAAARTRS